MDFALALAPHAGSALNADPSNRGLLFYSCFLGVGAAVRDLSGAGNHGRLVGSGMQGRGGYLPYPGMTTNDTGNSYCRVEDSDALDFSAEVTMECWWVASNFSGSNNLNGLMSKYQNGGANGPFLRTLASGDTGAPEFAVVIGGSEKKVQCPFQVQRARLTHAVGTYDGAAVRLYVNGVPVASTAASGAFGTNTDFLSVGVDFASEGPGTRNWRGTIAAAGLWNRALTAGEVRQRFAWGPHGALERTVLGLSSGPTYTTAMAAAFVPPAVVPELPNLMVPY